jgi:thiamine-monophosphate kinase
MAALDPDAMASWLADLWRESKRGRNVTTTIDQDDCAVLRFGNSNIVLTMDFLNASPIAEELGIGTPWNLGRLLVAANVSDLYGSGAMPIALLTGITLPRGSTAKEFKDVARGIKFEADRLGITVVGGDSKLGKSRALVGAALGAVPKARNALLRSNAAHGQLLWVSGNIGSVGAAVWAFNAPGLPRALKTWARRTIVEPHLPQSVFRLLLKSKIGRAGTDISDGLGADLWALCRTSNVGAQIAAEAIPMADEVLEIAQLAKVPAWKFALCLGGDFQFIITTSPKDREVAQNIGLYQIGETIRSRKVYICDDGTNYKVPPSGHRDGRRLPFRDEIQQLIATPLGKAHDP